MKITTIYFPDENEYEKIKELAYKERKTFSQIVREALDDYCKSHGTENKSIDIEKFLENPEFLSTPNFFAEIKTWETYATKCTDAEFKKWSYQINDLLNLEIRTIKSR